MQDYEGHPMATVTIRINDDTRDELEKIAQTQGVTLSDLLRGQINDLLGRGVPMRDDVPHALSPQQRLLLAQQHDILGILSADDYDSQHHRQMAEVLRQGFAGEYGELFAGIYPEMSRSECRLVWDILDMFYILKASIGRLPADERATLGEDIERRLEFAGFDLNDAGEGRMLGYVRYLVAHDRWTEMKTRLAEIGDDGNSHSPRIAAYERMLEVYMPIYEQIKKGIRGYAFEDRLLTADDLVQVAGEWVHPSNR